MATTTRGTTSPTATETMRNAPVRTAAFVVGAVFALVGIAGFVPGVTSNFDDITFNGPDSGAELLGIFAVSILHNIIHLGFGLLGFLAARTIPASRLYLIGGGALYLVLTLYGTVVDKAEDANFLPINTADNWLHLGLGLGMVALGFALTSRGTRDAT